MKKYFLILFLTSSSLIVNAQSKFKMGVNHNLGASTYYGNNMDNMGMSDTDLPVYSMKVSNGLGAKFQYAIKEKWAINLNTTYQTRGAILDKGMYGYSPRYKFNYIDFALGITFQTKEIIKKSKLFFNVSATYNRLLNSERVNNYESYNLRNDSKMNDFGALGSVGINIPRVEKDVIQLSLFANAGFKKVFSGVLAENNQTGKNLLFGLQVGYLFGFKGKTTQE